MNATAFDGGKVHRLTEQAARCGVGKSPEQRQWQMDLGDVTCRRCVKLEAFDRQQSAAIGDSERPGGNAE